MKPIYDHDGKFTGTVQGGNVSFPAIQENRHGRKFLEFLEGQGKMLEEWLAENPYVAPVKTQDEKDDVAERAELKKLDPASMTPAQKDRVLKLLLKRELRRI